MAKPETASKGKSREQVLAAARVLLGRSSDRRPTMAAVAAEAGCAKALIHYHFAGRSALIAAAGEQVWSARAGHWAAALGRPSAQDALDAGWDLLVRESADGTLTACRALAAEPNEDVGRVARDGAMAFDRALAAGTADLLRGIGLKSTVPVEDLGTMVAAMIRGLGEQLADRADPPHLKSAYEGFWAAVLSLTQSA